MSGALVTPSEGRVQVTVVVPEQAQPLPETETNVSPVGSVSVTEIEAAFEGPLFVTLSVYVTSFPQCTVLGLPDFAIERSAEVLTAVAAIPVLFVGSGS